MRALVLTFLLLATGCTLGSAPKVLSKATTTGGTPGGPPARNGVCTLATAANGTDFTFRVPLPAAAKSLAFQLTASPSGGSVAESLEVVGGNEYVLELSGNASGMSLGGISFNGSEPYTGFTLDVSVDDAAGTELVACLLTHAF